MPKRAKEGWPSSGGNGGPVFPDVEASGLPRKGGA
jgi:hypothetical protein